MMKVFVNGQEREVPAGSSVADLLAELDLAKRRVAVERNRSIVPRDGYESSRLAEGDRLEIVHFVGGG